MQAYPVGGREGGVGWFRMIGRGSSRRINQSDVVPIRGYSSHLHSIPMRAATSFMLGLPFAVVALPTAINAQISAGTVRKN